MQLSVSPDINRLIDEAALLATRLGSYYVGVEHLFQAISNTSLPLPRVVSDKYLSPMHTVCRELERSAWRGSMPMGVTEQFFTPRCAATISESARLAKRVGAQQANVGHLLLALLADAHASPSRAMDNLGLNRGDLLDALLKELQAAGPGATSKASKGQVAEATKSESDEQKMPAATNEVRIEQLTRDLTEMAKNGEVEAAIGRDNEIYQVVEVLARRSKNNVILVGEAGVGKTKIIEGLALAVAQGKLTPEFANTRILELNIASMMSGTQYRGAFEEKIVELLDKLKKSPNIILFIDEIHLIMGAGSTGEGGIDFANLLKPALGRGEIRCIGATTISEYRKFIEKDPAVERRFQMLRVESMSEAATYQVLKNIRPSFERHHGVKIDKAALKAAISLTQQYMPQRALPDKAIDVLDQSCARFRLKSLAVKANPAVASSGIYSNILTPHEIRKVVSQITAIPIEEITADERVRLSNLEKKLAKQIIGQDAAVTKAVAAVKKSRAGLADPNRPDAVMLFLGPTGVGKSQLAKALAENVFGSSDHLLTFDMSEYVESHSVARLIGAPPGYAGHDEEGRLTGAVRTKPFSILLFDEIEKAHPNVFDILLPVLDEGRLRDTRGREVSFKNCIIIFTSNIGAALLNRTDADLHRQPLMEALRKHFRPEFINRIDEIVPFYSLLFEDIREILKQSIYSLRLRLREKGLDVHVYQQAYEHLANMGYSPEYGARELRRVVERLVVNPISSLILQEQFNKGDIIEVKLDGGGDLRITRKLVQESAPSESTT